MLREPQDIHDSQILPYEYDVRLNGSVFKQLIRLDTVTLSYRIEDNTAQFTCWDPDNTEVSVEGLEDLTMPKPRVGDDVEITAKSVTGGTTRVIFRGVVRGISEHTTPSGLKYSCVAYSRVALLNGYNVTLTCNPLGELRPQPYFDPTAGSLTDVRHYTVAQIIRAIMDFRDAWNTSEPFAYADIDWNGLENDPRCGAFVPSDLSFSNSPKGDAISHVLRSAGSYVLHYDPDSDRLRVVTLNLVATNCGTEWPLQFRYVEDKTNGTVYYAHELQVQEDHTEWDSRQSANVCRVIGGHIRFYSGNFAIPEMIENTVSVAADGTETPVPENDRLHAIGPDSVTDQKARAHNTEGTYYRLHLPNALYQDTRKYQVYEVGLPLFPGWNPHADYLPDLTIIQGVISENGAFPAGIDATWYVNKQEFQPMTRGTYLATGSVRLGFERHLRYYEAWYAKDPCPCCDGTGNVTAVYENAENTPHITWVNVTRDGRLKYPVVDNYRFSPSDFGTPSAYVNHNLSAWAPTAEQQYPIPWKNLCPACRGVGLKPEYKIRNIQNDLVQGLANAVDSPTPVQSVSLDPQYIQTQPETWEDMQNRIIMSLPPQIQVEEAIFSPFLPLPPNDLLRMEKLLAFSKDTNYPESVRQYLFPHPLTGFNQRISEDLGTPRALTADFSEYMLRTYALFTKIDFDGEKFCQPANSLGDFIFHMPVCIRAKMGMSRWRVDGVESRHKHYLTPEGLLDGKGYMGGETGKDKTGAPMGYWRPARVWAQFFYIKEGFFWHSTAEPVVIPYTGADGITYNYLAKPMVIDGRWACEVVKLNPNEWAQQELGNYDFVAQTILDEGSAIIETTEADFNIMPVPGTTTLDNDAYEVYKTTTMGLRFARAHLFRWDKPTQGEVLVEHEGAIPEVSQLGLARPRLYSWRLRDDRPRLLAKAIRSLEEKNDLTVSGSLVLRGMLHDLAGGLGYIDYPGRGLATIVKITHDFSNGYRTTIEPSRMEARYGELPPDDAQRLSDLRNLLSYFGVRTNLMNLARGKPINSVGTSGAGGDGYTNPANG